MSYDKNLMQNTGTGYAKITYILYLVGLLFPIFALIGLVIAWVKRNGDGNPAWLEQHYRFQFQTFWFGLIYLLIGFLLTAFMIGWLILAWWLVWLIVRCIKGLIAIDNQTAIQGGFFSLAAPQAPASSGDP
ncbi:MAG: hypothetical protein CO158_08305 [Piscirickettsiaceae bacterium CG_4_9_14_3_um_filter_43_564]|nr:hypothetical protein [Thiomicrospira sp.]OIP93557.1 MAG: hypothetical protein AUK56_11465 [Thiomicrospira sp. CG2_30_44_34]PIQ05190.1 MAG: hypothetical protein COW74_03125 [Piscirickettsiaceae bacterium CG18_big_fil_WC_8_21_14_2_50_44_103]PIW57117.1 MAG: hypothetical protein COW14_07700 [Piscirickettsiaceae bacterium CG12_big_fil_rev_8_21_14_0_65_44_934]PIW78470.1 MAG: hypothetical protein CO000_01475 [Piscirickettsiaceae bacterium CG_4_8_14_3_um_filter_44_38]PIX79137.1 MAG: hypothetical pr